MPLEPREEVTLHNMEDAMERRQGYQIPPAVLEGITRDHDRGIPLPILIARSALTLYDRMTFLSRHPKLPSVLGGSAIKITWDGSLFTPDIGKFDAEKPSEEVFSRYQFDIAPPDHGWSTHNKILDIYDLTKHRDRAHEPDLEYKIWFRLGAPDTPADITLSRDLREESKRFSAQVQDPNFLSSPVERVATDEAHTYVLGIIRAGLVAMAPKQFFKKLSGSPSYR